MTNQVIPEAAVEAAREASVAWSIHDLPDDDEIRALLEAAAPHMLAEGWDAAAEFIRSNRLLGPLAERQYAAITLQLKNPYRPTK